MRLTSFIPCRQEITHILSHSEAVVILFEKQSQFKKVKGLAKNLQHVRHIITREKDSGKKGNGFFCIGVEVIK